MKLEILKKAKGSIAKKENIALLSMLLSLLVLLWLARILAIEYWGFGVSLAVVVSLWPLYFLFVVSAALALALKKVIGLLIAVPYFALLGDGFAGFMFYSITKFKPPGFPVEFIFLFAAPILTGFFIVLLWNKDESQKIKIYRVALLIQIAVAAGTVYYYSYHYGVRHLGDPVSVRSVRLGGYGLSRPLVEGDVAYIVNGDGRLFQVDLATARKRTLARIPLPKPDEAGLPGLVLPPREKGRAGPYLREGVLARHESGEISYRYMYSPAKPVRFDSGYGYNNAGLWTMDVRIDKESGSVSWQLREYEGPAGAAPYGLPVEYGGIALDPDDYTYRPFTILIEGEGIKTAIDPVGRVGWTHGDQGWILVGTDKGVVYIIATDVR
ncbi:MAG: PQQ-binding-like beta-propeller repeat protein [Bacillota bacterium]